MRRSPKRVRELLEQCHPLLEDIAMGRVVLFVGAGLSMGAGLPGWSGLLAALDDRLRAGLGPVRGDLLGYAQGLDERVGRVRLGAALSDILAPRTGPSPVQKALLSLPFYAVFTTNFDHLIEQALDAIGRRYDPIRYDEEVGVLEPDIALPVVKFHGDLVHPPGVVLTRNDYAAYSGRHPAFRPLFEALLATRTFLFVGFGLKDPNFLALDGTVRQALGRYRRNAWAVVVGSGPETAALPPPYKPLVVAPSEVDEFLLELVSAVRSMLDTSRHARYRLIGAIESARLALAAAVAELPSELTRPPRDTPFGRPTPVQGADALRPKLHSLVAQAEALGVEEPAVWRALGNALFHLRQYRAALRALGRLPQADAEASLTAARCHWYRDEMWRVRRVLEPLVYRRTQRGDEAVNMRLLDGFPAAIAMYTHACNWVAEEHLARHRPERAATIAARGLEALCTWLEDSGVPTAIPHWMWRYFYFHQGRAHALLAQAGQQPQQQAEAADPPLRKVTSKHPNWREPWYEWLRAWAAAGDKRAFEGVLHDLERLASEDVRVAVLARSAELRESLGK